MLFHSYKVMRAMVVGLMFFLAATAPCSSNSYDPDPYDNIPPVVTVDFNYVVPSGIIVRQPSLQGRPWQIASVRFGAAEAFSALPLVSESPLARLSEQSSPQLVIPLRR